MTTRKLPIEFRWRHELDQDTLYFQGIPVACVEPIVRGVMLRTLIRAPQLGAQETIVRSAEHGMAIATRWASERHALIRDACSRIASPAPASPSDAPEAPSVARWFQN